jgi:hypothetical protein
MDGLARSRRCPRRWCSTGSGGRRFCAGFSRLAKAHAGAERYRQLGSDHHRAVARDDRLAVNGPGLGYAEEAANQILHLRDGLQ